MPKLKLRCPTPSCARALQVQVAGGAPRVKLRCPACRATFAVNLTRKAPPPGPPAPEPEPEEEGTYGLARETNLAYLLRREQDGFTLTPEEKAAKKRLIRERLDADPGQCPACEARMGRRDVLCLECGFDIEAGRRRARKVEKDEEDRPRERPGLDIDEDDVEEVIDLAIDIISRLTDTDDDGR